jgi:hypothetical protein
MPPDGESAESDGRVHHRRRVATVTAPSPRGRPVSRRVPMRWASDRDRGCHGAFPDHTVTRLDPSVCGV